MSTEIGYITTRATRPISVTQFSGGNMRGTCVQLTQAKGEGEHENVQLDVEAAKQLICRLQSFVWDNC